MLKRPDGGLSMPMLAEASSRFMAQRLLCRCVKTASSWKSPIDDTAQHIRSTEGGNRASSPELH